MDNKKIKISSGLLKIKIKLRSMLKKKQTTIVFHHRSVDTNIFCRLTGYYNRTWHGAHGVY